MRHLKIEFNTKYNIGDTLTYTEELHDVTCRKVVILKVSMYYQSDSNETDISYYVRWCEDENNTYDEWVSECVLSDPNE